MSFNDWYHRHLAGPDPTPEPASPPPFVAGDRVSVAPQAVDGMFLGGRRGVVVDVEFTTDPDNAFGPWVIRVRLDGPDATPLKFHAAELTRESDENTPTGTATVFVKQPEDDEDFAADEPYVPTGEVLPDGLQHWLQRAKELRHERITFDTPVYDDVNASAMSRDGLAAEVEAYLAQVAAGGAA